MGRGNVPRQGCPIFGVLRSPCPICGETDGGWAGRRYLVGTQLAGSALLAAAGSSPSPLGGAGWLPPLGRVSRPEVFVLRAWKGGSLGRGKGALPARRALFAPTASPLWADDASMCGLVSDRALRCLQAFSPDPCPSFFRPKAWHSDLEPQNTSGVRPSPRGPEGAFLQVFLQFPLPLRSSG